MLLLEKKKKKKEMLEFYKYVGDLACPTTKMPEGSSTAMPDAPAADISKVYCLPDRPY